VRPVLRIEYSDLGNLAGCLEATNFRMDPRMAKAASKLSTSKPMKVWLTISIKNELVGPEHEAVELYPAESRLVDSAIPSRRD
jgi:hypothetical protein